MTRILIVDSHRPDHDTYREFLRGYDLLFCDSLAGGHKFETDVDPRNDIELDAAVVLWQSTGAESLTYLQRVRPNLPVIAIDETLNRTIFDAARRLGAVEFLLKPLEEDTLRQAVQRALGEGSLTDVVEQLRHTLLGDSRVWRVALENLARAIGRGREQILIIGESGTGKELAARAVHDLGAHSTGPFVAVNAGAVQSHLLESELFGHEKGAFTDARIQREGVFEQSAGGTLFLDEIGELPESLQAKLLRVIQERTFRRVGGNTDLRFTGRLVCATNKSLVTEVKEQRFRNDLYHRINTHEVYLPPLRERRGDWMLLAQYFLDKHGVPGQVTVSMAARSVLADCQWPGNARELENVILQCLSHYPHRQVLPSHLPPNVVRTGEDMAELIKEQPAFLSEWFNLPQKPAMEAIEIAFNRQYLPKLLDSCHNNLPQAAKKAGLDPKTFKSKWDKAGLPPLNNRD